MAEDHTYKGVGECHPYREFEGSVANIAQGAMQGQLPLSGWGLSSQGVEQFGRSEALVSGLHHHRLPDSSGEILYGRVSQCPR